MPANKNIQVGIAQLRFQAKGSDTWINVIVVRYRTAVHNQKLTSAWHFFFQSKR